MQDDYFYVRIHVKMHEIMNIADAGTRYGERTIVESRPTGNIKKGFETMPFYCHGVPERFGADHEFCRPVLKTFMEIHWVKLKPRPSRSSKKSGKVERSNEVMKEAIDRL